MTLVRHALALAAKDLRSEIRTKEAINASFSFAMVILLLFSFAFEPTADEMRGMAGGLLWLIFAFSGVLVLNRSYAREVPNDCLDALLASPVSPAALFLGKALANLVLIVAIEVVCFPVFGVFYNVRWTQQLGPLALVTLLGTWGLVVVGTMFSALTVNIRLREVMLPLLVYTVMTPCLLAAMQVTGLLVSGEPLAGEAVVWLKFLIGFDLIFTSLALALVETVMIS
ncbi:MAG: heme exporter protein CcmB [Bryobacteraceae bacterium]